MNPPMYLSYDDPAPRVRPATARIWRDCARRMMIWTAVYAVIAAAGLILYACGFLLPYLPMS